MRALGNLRKQTLKRQNESLAKPPRRDAYTTQTQTLSYNEILQLDSAAPSYEIQNADGSFVFMAGYDRL